MHAPRVSNRSFTAVAKVSTPKSAFYRPAFLALAFSTLDGNAYCWGGNDMGELGNRTTTPSTTPVRVKLFAP
ncbi:MAG: hypothetical protein ACJ78M_02355 [Gemmatimonadaceae bacterium]